MSSSASSHNRSVGEAYMSDQFPVGLRVLVVDDDVTSLRILEQMLRKCLYYVKTCSHAFMALQLLREQKGFFDVVLSDVHMHEMDGFKLLEYVGLEMDLPVIMMSVDMNTSTVMRGIKHGACDYLIKPIRMEQLKNIWQHVVRKKWNEQKLESSGSFDESDHHKREFEDLENASSVNDGGSDMVKCHRKRMDGREDDGGELESDDPGTSKKPRVVWSVELHQQFVSAVNQLGIDKAVPKRILELMNVPGLTRENVASHLQKFRLYIKRLSGMAQQRLITNPLCGQLEPNIKLGSALGRLDIQTMAALGQVPPQTLAALHADLLGQTPSSLSVSAIDQATLLQASFHGSKPEPSSVPFGQSPPKCQAGFSRTFLPGPLHTASWHSNADPASIDSIPPLPPLNAPQIPLDPSPLLDPFHSYSYNLLCPAASSFSLSAQEVPGFGSNPNVGGLSDHGLQWNSGRVVGAYNPTRFTVDETELSRSGSSSVKVEQVVETTGLSFGKNDLMSVISK